jgi:hypothetical protein
MTALQSIYDFETPVETALAFAFGDNLIPCYTPSNDGIVTAVWIAANPELSEYVLSAHTFQKARPRVELLVKTGQAQQRNYATSDSIQPIGGYAHDQGRAVGITIKVVTAPEILEHRAYVALVRGLMATILSTINGDETQDDAIAGSQLTLHRIPVLDEAGSSNAYNYDDGLFATDLNYTGQITIQEDALAALTT